MFYHKKWNIVGNAIIQWFNLHIYLTDYLMVQGMSQLTEGQSKMILNYYLNSMIDIIPKLLLFLCQYAS